MLWITVIITLAAAYYVFAKGRDATPVVIEAPVASGSGDMTAIEYFWRPG